MEPLAYIRHVTSTHDLEKEMEREQKVQVRGRGNIWGTVGWDYCARTRNVVPVKMRLRYNIYIQHGRVHSFRTCEICVSCLLLNGNPLCYSIPL